MTTTMNIPPRSILVPTDFSEPSNAAVDYAVNLAEKLGGDIQLHVINAFEFPVIGLPDGTLTITADIASRITNGAQKALDNLTATYKGRKINLHTSLEQADPREAILTVAKRVHADLIIMGTHGRRGIVRALIGSVAESVIRTSPIPVLTIHAPE